MAVLAACALGASALAGAASNGNGTNANSATTNQTQSAPAPPMDSSQPVRPDEKLLTGDTASKVKAAALDKVSGGTIIRLETNADGGTAYEAHVKKSDGSEVIVQVDKNFDVASVVSGGGPGGGPGGPPPGGAPTQ